MITAVLRRDGAGPAALHLDRALRIALGIGVALCVAWAIAHDTAPCSVDRPQTCGADPDGSAAIGLLFAAPVLLWLLPTLACATLVVFAVWDVALDDLTAAHGPFVGLAVAAVAVALLHRRLVAAARPGDGAAVPVEPGSLPAQLSDRATGDTLDHDAGFVVTLAAAGALLVAVTATGIGVAAIRADAAHRARAERVAVVVTGHETTDDDTVVDVRAADGRTWSFEVLELGTYPVGAHTLVAVDPTDVGWHELVAEPHDPTPWLALASGALVLGLGGGVRAFEAAGRRPRGDGLIVRAPRATRVRAGVVAAGSIAVGPAGVWLADTWPERLTAGLGAANAAWVGVSRWTRGVDADRVRVRLHTGWWSRDLPWSAVGAVQTLGATVLVADDRGEAHVFGPFEARPGHGALEHALDVDRRLTAWRIAPPSGRQAERPPRRSPAPAGLVTAGLLVVECVTGVLATV